MSHKILSPLKHPYHCCDMEHGPESIAPPASHTIYAAFYILSLCDECLAKLKRELNDA